MDCCFGGLGDLLFVLLFVGLFVDCVCLFIGLLSFICFVWFNSVVVFLSLLSTYCLFVFYNIYFVWYLLCCVLSLCCIIVWLCVW